MHYEDVMSPSCTILLFKYTTMAMVTLRWSSFIEYTTAMLITLVLDEQLVRSHCCVSAQSWRCDWCSMRWVVISSPSYAILLSKYTTMAIMTLRGSLFIEYMAGTAVVLALPSRAGRTFVLLRVCLNLKLLLRYGVVIILYCPNALQYNGDDNFALIFVRWTYKTGIVLVLDEQCVSLLCCMCTRCHWFSTQYEVKVSLSSFTVQIHCNNWWQLYLCGCLFVGWIFVRWLNAWNGCRVGPKRTESTFVLLRMRLNLEVLLVFDAVWGRSLTLSRYICCPNTLQWRWWLCVDASAFVGCMHWTGVVLILGEQVVRLHCCVCAWTWRCYWCWVNALWWGRMLTLLICWRWRLCVDLRLLTDARVDPERTVCTFIYCLNLTRVTKVRWLQCHSHALLCCSNTLQWQWWLCVDLRLLVKCIMKRPGIVLALNEQKVRFYYCCVRART